MQRKSPQNVLPTASSRRSLRRGASPRSYEGEREAADVEPTDQQGGERVIIGESAGGRCVGVQLSPGGVLGAEGGGVRDPDVGSTRRVVERWNLSVSGKEKQVDLV